MIKSNKPHLAGGEQHAGGSLTCHMLKITTINIGQYTLIVNTSWELQGKSKKYSTGCSLDKPAATGAR